MVSSRRTLATTVVVTLLLCASLVLGQQNDYSENYGDYQDYGGDGGEDYYQDNLYHDYAQRQQDKQAGAGGGGGGGMGKLVVASALSWFLGGKIHARRSTKKLKAKFQIEQKALYSQYYNDVYKLTEQNTELSYMIEQLQSSLTDTKKKAEMDALQRDYDEFKQPDIDGDDRISRAEFNMYVKNYLSNYPGLKEKDYPKFEDFDHDGDGFVSFQEYAQQMALQVQQAELEQHSAQQAGASSSASAKKTAGMNSLYNDAKKYDSFQDLYAAYGQ